MKQRLASAFLQVVVVLIGIGVLALMLWEPHLEGRNAHATLFEIYFKDPFLAYVYIGSIAFFVALYQAFKLLGHAGQGTIVAEAAVKSRRTIKAGAICLIGLVAVGEAVILLQTSDDRAGGVAIGVLIALASAVIATAAAMLERIVHNVVSTNR